MPFSDALAAALPLKTTGTPSCLTGISYLCRASPHGFVR
jgi:hypothetical protein